LLDAANYCRNPDDYEEGPWCYTTSSDKRWEICGIPLCPQDKCKIGAGTLYSGNVARTSSGITCQRWDASFPHEPSSIASNVDNFPDASLLDAANYCRNPDDYEEGPWCYTTSSDKRWEVCDIPTCPYCGEDHANCGGVWPVRYCTLASNMPTLCPNLCDNC